MSKEGKPREWQLVHSKDYGGYVSTGAEDNSGQYNVIEYTPEVKRAVELNDEVIEALSDLISLADLTSHQYKIYREIYNRAKGQA